MTTMINHGYMALVLWTSRIFRLPERSPDSPQADHYIGNMAQTDTFIVQDESGSMGHCDLKPNRLTGGKEAALEYLKLRAEICPDDRVALIGFDTSARIHLPLTSVQQLDVITEATDKLSVRGGTNIAVGLKAVPKLIEQPFSFLEFYWLLFSS